MKKRILSVILAIVMVVGILPGFTLAASAAETTYAVTVDKGTGSGEYEENETVTITADAPESGMKFAGWTSNDGVTFADSKASTTTFAMPAHDVTVTATYAELLPGKVIVNGIDLVNGEDDHAIDCGDGTAVYDPDTCTLTLTDAEITTPTPSSLASCGIYASDLSGDLTIVLVGDNSIVLTDTAYDNTGIYKWGSTDLIIEGSGSLYIELFDDTSLQGIGDIIIQDVTLEFAVTTGSKTSGDMIHTNKTSTLDNANVSISEPKYYQAITSVGGITIKNGSVVNVTALENAIYSEGDIVIEDSTVTAEVPDFAAICGWGDIVIKDSAVTAQSEWDNGLYCYGEVIISGGEVTVTSDENDAFRSNGGITITDDAKVTAEGYGAGVYTNEILSVESGELTAKGENWAILARRINENSENNEPTDDPAALILGDGLVEASGAVIVTDDWIYTGVWDDWDWDYYDKWMSRSYFVDAAGNRLTEAKIVRAYTVTFDTNGGSAVAPITQVYGTSISAPKSPTKFAAKFAGWYADPELTDEYEFTTMPAENITLYAKWSTDISPLVPVLVKFDVNIAHGMVGGDVATDKTEASAKSEVTVTVTPKEGYEASAVVITDENGKIIEVTKNDDGTYSFEMPMSNVTVCATFDKTETEIDPTEPEETDDECKRDEDCPLADFADLEADAWYHDGVHYSIEKGLMSGMGDGIFAPDGKLSRAMLVTMLWRLEGKPVVNYLMTFEDVEQDAWYAEAVRWAASEKIIEGYSATAFGPDDAITREQLAAIIYRYEQHKGGGFKGLWMFRMDYTDLSELSEWAYEAMCWCSMNGIVTGKPEKVLDPKGSATRAEASTMLWRYCELANDEN